MPEIFLEFIGDASPWLVPLLVVLAVWGKFNWAALNNPDKKASFERAVGWLREDSFGQLYLGFLGGLMDRVGGWIGDRQRLSQDSLVMMPAKEPMQRMFGFNPFTSESYEKCLWLAFMYPVLAYLLAWAMGAEGEIGNINLFGIENTKSNLWQRWALVGGVVLFVSVNLWWVLRWQRWEWWLALGILLLITSIESIKFEATENTIVLSAYSLGFFLIFLFIFILLYLGGRLTELIAHKLFQVVDQKTYELAFTIASAVSVTGAVSTVVANPTPDADAISKIVSEAVIEALGGAGIFSGALTLAGASAFTVVFTVAVAVRKYSANTFANTVVGAIVGALAFNATYNIAIIAGFADGSSTAVVSVLIITLAFAIIIVGIIISTLQILQQWSENRGTIHWFWLIYSALLIVIGVASLKSSAHPKYMLLILLWLLLPLINAPLDWLSLGVTRGLLQAVRTGNHSVWRTLSWAVADLLLAFIFLFLITAVLVGITALGNAVAGKTLVDIGCILSNLKTNAHHPDHWWIYFMLLSTLVPTLFHFALAGGAATLWLPRKWRTQLADGLEEDIHKTFGAWVYLTFTPVIGFILMPLALLWSLWWLLNTNGGALGTLLLNWATGLAQWADPAMMLSCSAG